MARAPWAGPAIYDAAGVVKQRCLLEDGSLFADGRAVWTLEGAELLSAQMSEDKRAGLSFIEKLKLQVTGLEPELVMLAAEVLYLELLGELDTGGGQKHTHIASLLELLDASVVVPEQLDQALRAGGVANYAAGKSHRDAYVRFLCRVVAGVKTRGASDRTALLDDPWQFRELVEEVRTSTDGLQANALLHLLYPQTFEYVIGPTSRQQLVSAFAGVPGVGAGENEDRKIEAIRGAADALAGRELDLYSDPFHRVWAGERHDRWDEFTGWAARLYERSDFDETERDYKVEVAAKLAEARRLLLVEDEAWMAALTAAIKLRKNNLLDFRVKDNFLKWCESQPTPARELIGELWSDHLPLEDRVGRFLDALPNEPAAGPGTRASIVSFLLMAADRPPGFFKPTIYSLVKKALSLPGSLMMDPETSHRPEDLAARLGVSGERARSFLRRSFPREASEQYAEWHLSTEQTQAVVDHFSGDEESDSASALFFEWQVLLEELALRLLARGVQIRDAIDAQGLAYWVVFPEPPEDWPDDDCEKLLAFRAGASERAGGGGGTTSGDTDGPTRDPGLPAATPELAAELFLDTAWLQEAIDLLSDKRQIVLYGPPGTGKTFIGRRLAKHLVASEESCRLVQFHPSYTYEDFFEGYRPRSDGDGDLSFELAHGALREMADAARREPDRPHVLIIDEINRGNVAKVFGELYFLLEYRDEEIALQYSPRERFSLPENLFLIATMNTADRSIALVDSALRRRFHFVELSPTSPPVNDVLRRWLAKHDLNRMPADLLNALNAAIGDDEFAIGPSYFMTEDGSARDLDRVWRHDLKPLLEERYFGSGRDIEAEFGLKALGRRLAEAADSGATQSDGDGPLES